MIDPIQVDLVKWWLQAACKGMGHTDSELFFPTRGDTKGIEKAKAVCRRCPVREVCLEEHLGERFGVWGGMSERERKKLRKQRRSIPAHGTRTRYMAYGCTCHACSAANTWYQRRQKNLTGSLKQYYCRWCGTHLPPGRNYCDEICEAKAS